MPKTPVGAAANIASADWLRMRGISADRALVREPQADTHGASSIHAIKPVPKLIARFPSTRFYGSERKLRPWLYRHLSTNRFDTGLDAFGGTGSVSLLFKAMHKRVTYHDGFRFNEDVARTVLAPHPAPTRQEVEEKLEAVKPCGSRITAFLGHLL